MHDTEFVDKTVQCTVEWVNEVRRQYGFEPIHDLPQGYIHDENHCPVANGLMDCGYRITVSDVAYVDGMIHKYPTCVKDFIEAFDNGQYAGYENDDSGEWA